MTPNLDSQFVVNLQTKTIEIDRLFHAPRALVWRAWTEPELLDKWWGPAPCRVETKSMDFRVGGNWHYAMILPDDSRHWNLVDYSAIDPRVRFKGESSFCDESATRNPQLPVCSWDTQFRDQQKDTLVQVQLAFDKEEDLKHYVNMGFKEGFNTGMNQLSQLLESIH